MVVQIQDGLDHALFSCKKGFRHEGGSEPKDKKKRNLARQLRDGRAWIGGKPSGRKRWLKPGKHRKEQSSALECRMACPCAELYDIRRALSHTDMHVCREGYRPRENKRDTVPRRILTKKMKRSLL